MILLGAVLMAISLMLHGWLNEHDPFRQVFLWVQRLIPLTFFSGAVIAAAGLILATLE